MAKSPYSQQISGLCKTVTDSAKLKGEDRIKKMQAAVGGLMDWLNYLQRSEKTGCCDDTLSSVRAAAVETTGGVSLGLVRLAVFAMRGEIDLALSWLFFKDHPVEWNHLCRTGREFKLKKEIFEYLDAYHERFSERLALLQKHKRRKVADPYKLLSAHIHSQGSLVMPTFATLDAMVYSDKHCSQVIELQREVTEYIGDIFLAVFGSKWASLPDNIVSTAKARIPIDKQPIVFS